MSGDYWKCPICALRIHPDDAKRNAERCPACLNEEARTGIRYLHTKREWGGKTFCEECGNEWPCPTRQVVAGKQR